MYSQSIDGSPGTQMLVGRITLYRILLCLAVVAPLISALAAPRAGAQPSDGFIVLPGQQGLEFGQVIDDNGQVRFTDDIAARIAESGAAWVHINFRLGGFQDWQETETFGYSALSLYDEIIATAERHGLRVIGLLSNEAWHGHLANWQAGNVENGRGDGGNGYLLGFTTDVALVLATHFAGRVNEWEIWNEPNATITYLYPSNFAWLLGRVYVAVKNAGLTSVRFISGGLSSKQAADGTATSQSTGADYLAATYAAGKTYAQWEDIRATYGSYPLDAIGQHIYVDGFNQTNRQTVRTALDLVRAAYVVGEDGDPAKQTIITEMGWASGNVSERVQADNLQLAFTEILNTPYVQTASWFFLRDEPRDGLGFGLLRSDGSEKPAWRGYRTITTPAAPPVEPFGVVATGFPTGIRIEWHANLAPDLAGYLVYRGATPSGPFALLATEPLSATAFVDSTAPIGSPVYYRVTAIDTGGNESGFSTTAGAVRLNTSLLDEFIRTWQRTDLPVAEGQTQRTWIWGVEPLTGVLTERYDDAPDGWRAVQYFDKSRMERANPEEEQDPVWSVTNGLLVWELMTGWMQVGDTTFIEGEPATVNVAGDPESGPTYAALSRLRWADERPVDVVIVWRVDALGNVSTDTSLATRDVRTAQFVPETGHTVAAPFWEFMNTSGLIHEDGTSAEGLLFENPFYATGFPITEAYWTTVEVNETPTDVLIQCFQRRCLTYTPDNAAGWQVEAGNVGWHYYQWRYGQQVLANQ